jgi:large subunit ribosomal protein L13
MGVPEELKDKNFERIEDAILEKVSKTDKYVTLAEVSRYLGFRGV